jgi:N-acetylglutamate synthase-like GNAT family acetyltransferase
MNTQLAASHAAERRPRARRVQARPAASLELRAATRGDAPAIHALIQAHLEEGHLLPRSLDELVVHAPRFVVAVRHGSGRGTQTQVVGCAELAPLSGTVAEVRSLVVDRSARGVGLGRHLLDHLHRKARLEGFEKLCAFTHDAGYFVRKGFSIVPHAWVPEKIARDCHQCALFRRCGQHAVVLALRG